MSECDSDHDHNDDVPPPVTDVVYPVGVETEVPNTKGQLFKTVLVEGTGPKPPHGSKVSVHYVGTLASDGSKFDSSRDRDSYFDFTIGKGQVIKGWDQGVATMKKGEKCNLRCLPEYAYGANGSPPKIPANATLNFEVELFDWTKSEDISEAKDKSLTKDTKCEGKDYDHPEYETKLTAKVAGFEVSHPGGERKLLFEHDSFAVEIGETELPVGLEKALTQMKDQEEATITVAPKLTIQDEPKFGIRRGATIEYDIKILSMNKVKTWTFKGADKVAEGMKRKDQGNAYFKAAQWAKAEKKYRRSLEFIEYDHGLEDADKEQAKQIKVSVFANLAQVLLNQGNYKEAITYANKTLEVDGGNVKALYRRGKAQSALDEWDEAKADFKKCLEFDPSNTAATVEYEAVQQKIRNYDQQQKSRFGNMFAKLSKMEEKEATSSSTS